MEGSGKAREGKIITKYMLCIIWHRGKSSPLFMIIWLMCNLFNANASRNWSSIPRFSTFQMDNKSECSFSWAKWVSETSTISRRHFCPWRPADSGPGHVTWVTSTSAPAGESWLNSRPAALLATANRIFLFREQKTGCGFLEIFPISLGLS